MDNVVFVMVRPNYLGNIGSATRVLKNFGFRRLALVQPPGNYKDAEARRMSVGAFDVLKAARVYETLSDAVKTSALVVGTSAGQQRSTKPMEFSSGIEEILRVAERQEVAILLGEEKNGLSVEDLKRCHAILTIPVNPDFPSLNVAQAAGIIGYELTRAAEIFSGPPPSKRSGGGGRQHTMEEPTVGAEDDELVEMLAELLDAVEFSRAYNRQLVLTELRGLFQRLRPTKREASLVKGVLHKVQLSIGRNSKDSEGD